MKKILVATALTFLCSSAFAQTQPAPGASSSGNVGPGATSPTMKQNGAMQPSNMGSTTGNAMKPDASQQGAPTGAAVGATGTSTEPGKVKDGASR